MKARLTLVVAFTTLMILLLAACVAPPPQQAQIATAPVAQEETTPAAADPLPSWNPGPPKEAILKFVADVTDQAGPSYVKPADRVAVFDNDGTLWTEKPIPPQGAFIFQRIAEMAPEHPEWQTTQPYQAVLEQDAQALQQLSPEDMEKLVLEASAGMTVEEFDAEARAFLATAKQPRFGVPYTETVFQPMLELLAYLQANGFKTFIVSGGGVDFMRAFSEEVYGIPRENVVGSSLQYKFEQTAEGTDLVREAALVSFDDGAMKASNIQLHTGRRPILAAGNSDGDLEMLQYTGGDAGPYLNLLIVHDDAEREYAYLTGTDEVMAAAAQSPWSFVSMKNDFKTVFPVATQPVTATAAPTATGTTIEPLPAEVCNGQAQAMAQALGVTGVTQSEAPMSDWVNNASGAGCEATVTGTGEQFDSPDAVAQALGSMLEDEGWTQDPMLDAGGPTGVGFGYRKGEQLCLTSAGWWPDESANCPQDQPVSACQVTPAQQNYTVTLNCGVEVP